MKIDKDDFNQGWITALSFCQLNDNGNLLDGGSSSHGFAVTTIQGQVWPMPEGEPIRDLGCVLVVPSSDMCVDLGVFVVVYGMAALTLSLSLFETSPVPSTNPVFNYSMRISVGALGNNSGPGPKRKRIRLRKCPIHAPGSYILAASVGESHAMKIPLYVYQQEQWILLKRSTS